MHRTVLVAAMFLDIVVVIVRLAKLLMIKKATETEQF